MARYTRLFLHPRFVCAVVLLLALQHVAAAQSSSAFTAEDMLKVASISILDVTEDGQRIAASIRRPLDNETTDHRRYGDPSYLAPSRVTLQIIDTRTGAVDSPFKQLVNVRDVAWSRDGKQLAILLANDPATADGFPTTALHVWNTADEGPRQRSSCKARRRSPSTRPLHGRRMGARSSLRCVTRSSIVKRGSGSRC